MEASKNNPEDNKESLRFIREVNSEIQKQLRRRGVPSRLRSAPANPNLAPKLYTDFTIQKSFHKKEE